MTPPKSRYASDPFLTALVGAPRQQLLTRAQAAGFFRVSLTTLDAWRNRGLPPPYVDLRGMVRYKCGDLMDFVDRLPTSRLTEAEPSTPAQQAPTMPVPAGELQRLGLYAPIMRGGRRRATRVQAFVRNAWRLDESGQVTAARVQALSKIWLGDVPMSTPWRFLDVRMPRRQLSPASQPAQSFSVHRLLGLIASLSVDLDAVKVVGWKTLTLDQYVERLVERDGPDGLDAC